MPPSPFVSNPRKKDLKINKNCPRLSMYSIYPVSRKIIHVSSRYRIFDPGGHMIRSEHIKNCLTAQTRFMLFKGPGSFKINFKIGGNVDELKAYRLIPLTPPPSFFILHYL
jgi:hypothetical protein